MLAWSRDSASPRPWATWGLLAATLLVQLAAGGRAELWGRYGVVPADPSLSGLLGHLLLHAGPAHLLGTLFFVAAVGPGLEARFGRGIFLAVYVASGLAGASAFVAAQAGAEQPWLGGSAAVAGLLGALAVCARRAPLDLLATAGGAAGSLRAPGWALLALFGGGELAGLLANGPELLLPDLASLVFGAALAAGLRKSGAIESQEPAFASEETEQETEAASRRGESPARTAPDRGALEAQLWEAIERKQREPAKALWRRLVASGAAPCGRSALLIELASWLGAPGSGAERSAALHAALRDAEAAAIRDIARLARRRDPVLVYRAAERGLADPALAPSERQALEQLRVESQREIAARGIILIPHADAPAPARPPARVAVHAGPRAAREAPAPPRVLQFGEAIELEAEPGPPPVALPDPKQAGDAAFLDAFHAALNEGWDAQDAKGEAEPALELDPDPEPRLELDPEPEGGPPLEIDLDPDPQLELGPPEVEPAPEPEPKPQPAPALRTLRVREALPRGIADDALLLEVGGRSIRLGFARIHAIALAGVRGLSERSADKAVLLVDLCLSAAAEPELQVLRMRSDRFDPRALAPDPGEASPLKALRGFVALLAQRSRAALLPAEDAVGSAPLRIFVDLASYQREVLRAG